jgi:hypothetical protein
MLGWPRSNLSVFVCVVALAGGCKDDPRGDDGTGIGDPPGMQSDAGVDAGASSDAGPDAPLSNCETDAHGSFEDELALVGAAPFDVRIQGNEVHVLYLKPACRDAATQAITGTGLAYVSAGAGDAFPASSTGIFANDADSCRTTREPVLTLSADKARAYFLADDPTLHVTSEVYGIDVSGAGEALRVSNIPGEESALAATMLDGLPLLAWAASEQGKPASLWTARDDGAPHPYLLVPSSEKHVPGRVALATLSPERAVLVWSSAGEVEGVFLQVVDRQGEPVGHYARVSDSSGELALAVAAAPDDEGFAGAVAYTVDGRLRFRRFTSAGKVEDTFRVVSPGNLAVSGISLAPAFGTGYAAGYRNRVTTSDVTREIVQVTVVDSQGNVAGSRVLTDTGTGVGSIRLEQARDGRFVLAWADRTSSGVKLHVQRTLCH